MSEKRIAIKMDDNVYPLEVVCEHYDTDACGKCTQNFNCYLNQYLLIEANDLKDIQRNNMTLEASISFMIYKSHGIKPKLEEIVADISKDVDKVMENQLVDK